MPAGPVFQAGTLSGNPLAMAAGLATLEELRDTNPYPNLEKLGAMLEAGLSPLAPGGRGVGDEGDHRVQRVGSMWTLFFNAEPVIDYDTAKKSDAAKFGRFFWAMMDRGIYLPCSWIRGRVSDGGAHGGACEADDHGCERGVGGDLKEHAMRRRFAICAAGLIALTVGGLCALWFATRPLSHPRRHDPGNQAR